MKRTLKVGILGYAGEEKDEFAVQSGTYDDEPLRGVLVTLYSHGDPEMGTVVQVSAADARKMGDLLTRAAAEASR